MYYLHVYSKCYHSLVQMSMGSGENSSDMVSKEQAWGVLVEVLDLLQSRAKVRKPTRKSHLYNQSINQSFKHSCKRATSPCWLQNIMKGTAVWDSTAGRGEEC